MDYIKMLETVGLLLKVAAVKKEEATVIVHTSTQKYEVRPDGIFV